MSGVARLVANHQIPTLEAFQEPGSLARPALPGFINAAARPTPVSATAQSRRRAATLAATGLPGYPDHLVDVPCPLPRSNAPESTVLAQVSPGSPTGFIFIYKGLMMFSPRIMIHRTANEIVVTRATFVALISTSFVPVAI